MAFNRPSLREINERIAGDIETRLPSSEPRLRRSLFAVLGQNMAGVSHGLHGHLEYNSKQILPSTADADHLPLHTGIWNVPAKNAEYAIGNILVTGAGIVPEGAIYQRGDGIEYSANAETIITGSVSVAVTAIEAGAAGNAIAGVTLTSVETLAGLNSQALVDSNGLTNGSNDESTESNRDRLEARIQNPPMGGAKHDYVRWALEVPGVTRAWCYSNEMGIGTTTVRFVRDDDTSLIPDSAEELAVYDYIDAKRQTGMKGLYVVGPVAVALDLTIALTPNNLTVQAAVQAELDDLLRRESLPEDGNGSGKILLSHLREAISVAAGETDHTLISPSADVTHSIGEMAVMGTITWV